MTQQGSNIYLQWDEENRLRLADMPQALQCAYYQYDASGERFYKNVGVRDEMINNGHTTIHREYGNPVLYASPYVVIANNSYTKHYFAENERFASRIGDGDFADIGTHTVPDSILATKQTLTNNAAPRRVTPNKFSFLNNLTANWSSRHTTYWQHSDHLGSASWVTDTAGHGYEHFQYNAWGGPFITQRITGGDYQSRYTFSGKERDEETGYSYFGARYHNSALSIWLSVDPMSDKYPRVSPYTYCANNPVRIQDPNGEDIWEVNEKGYTRWVSPSDEQKIFFTKGRSEHSFGKRITTGIGENKQEVCIDNKKVDEFMKNFHPDSEGEGHLGALVDNEDNRDFAKQFMKEVSQHTEVEWGYTGSKHGLLYISTTNEKGMDDCSGRIVRQLAKNGNLSFAYHVQHDYCFGSTDDYKNIESLGFPDATFGIIYQRQLYNFKGLKIDWP